MTTRSGRPYRPVLDESEAVSPLMDLIQRMPDVFHESITSRLGFCDLLSLARIPSRCTVTFIQSYASFPAVFPIRASTNAIVVSHATRYRNTFRSIDTYTIDGFGFTSTSPSPGCENREPSRHDLKYEH